MTTAQFVMSVGIGLLVGLLILGVGLVSDERHDRRMVERRELERQQARQRERCGVR